MHLRYFWACTKNTRNKERKEKQEQGEKNNTNREGISCSNAHPGKCFYAQLASDGARTRLKNQHLILCRVCCVSIGFST